MGQDAKQVNQTLESLDHSIAALEQQRDKILAKKDAYPENSEKSMKHSKKLDGILQDLRAYQLEKEEIFQTDAYSEEKLPYMAAYHGSLHALKEFVSTMSPMTSSFLEYVDPTTGNTPFLIACARGNIQVAKLLIAVGANVDARNKVGYTAFHVACQHGQVEIVELLLTVPYFSPYVRDHQQQTALHIARNACLDHDAWVRYKECARLLEERCCIFRGWAYESTRTSGVTKMFSSQWKLRYVVILRTQPTSTTLEMCLYSAKVHARCPPVPTSTLYYTLGYPIRTIQPGDTKKKPREHAFTFQARRDLSSAMFSVEFAAVSADGFAAWTDFFDVYSNLSNVCDALLLRTPDDEELEQAAPSSKAVWSDNSTAPHQSIAPSAPALSPHPGDAPSAPSLALSPSAQVAFEVGHEGFDGIKKNKVVDDKLQKSVRTSSVSTSRRPTERKPKLVEALFASDENEEKDDRRRRDCIVCFDGPQDAVCVPCGHNAICMDCAQQLMSQSTRPCPVCRKNIREVVRIYQG